MKAIQNTILLLLLILSLPSCESGGGVSESQPTGALPAGESDLIPVSKAQFQELGMKLGPISAQPLKSVVAGRGYIDLPPENRASVSPFAAGFVQDSRVLAGEMVRKGQVLFTLKNPDFLKMQQDYLEAKAQLGYLKTDFERQQTLADENIASRKNFGKAESDYQVMEARCHGLREQLKLLGISPESLEKGDFTSVIAVYAPISGRVSQVHLEKGAYIDTGHEAVRIVNRDHLHLELKVFEQDAFLLREGQQIHFSLADSSAGPFLGEVYLIGSEIESTNRSVNIHGHIEEAEKHNFLPGMFVDAEIVVAMDTGAALPVDAVVEAEGGNVVLTLQREDADNYYFRTADIVTGKRSGEWLEIISSEALQGKQILLKGAFQVQ